ncbi:MAG: hypothetical protein ABI624_11820 [Casimicrobiaceae bacterium]
MDGALVRDAQVRRMPQMPPQLRPAEDAAQPAQAWNACGGLLRRIEGAFAVAVLAGLLGLTALTFGYAIDALAAAQPARTAAAAASR